MARTTDPHGTLFDHLRKVERRARLIRERLQHCPEHLLPGLDPPPHSPRSTAIADGWRDALLSLAVPERIPEVLDRESITLSMFTGTLRNLENGRWVRDPEAPRGWKKTWEPSESQLGAAVRDVFGGHLQDACGFVCVDRGGGLASRVDHWHVHGLTCAQIEVAQLHGVSWHARHGFSKVDEVFSAEAVSAYAAKVAQYAAGFSQDGYRAAGPWQHRRLMAIHDFGPEGLRKW